MKKLTAVILAILLPAIIVSAAAEFFPDIIVKGAPWYDVRGYSDLDAAATAVGASGKTMLIIGNVSVPASKDISSIPLWFLGSGKFTVAAGQALTVGSISAGVHTIFVGPGTVVPTNYAVKAEWFGGLSSAIPILSTTACEVEIGSNQAITASTSAPATMALSFIGQGKLTISAGQTFTAAGPVRAIVNRQIFFDNGAFVPPTNQTLYADWWASFAKAVADIAANVRTLTVTSAEVISGNLTVPATLSTDVLFGGSLAPAGGTTLTLNGPFSAGLYQVFSGAGTIAVGVGVMDVARVEWWGALGDGTTDDAAAINAALAVIGVANTISGVGWGTEVMNVNAPGSGGVQLRYNKTYLIKSTLKYYPWTRIDLNGSRILWDSATAADMMIEPYSLSAGYRGVVIENGTLDGAGVATAGLNNERVNDCIFRNLLIINCLKGERLAQAQYNLHERVRYVGNTDGVVFGANDILSGYESNENTWVACETTRNSNDGIRGESGAHNRFLGVTSSRNGRYEVNIEGGTIDSTFFNLKLEKAESVTEPSIYIATNTTDNFFFGLSDTSLSTSIYHKIIDNSGANTVVTGLSGHTVDLPCRLTYTPVGGSFVAEEVITGTSGATAKVGSDSGTVILTHTNSTTVFLIGDTITGAGGATGTVTDVDYSLFTVRAGSLSVRDPHAWTQMSNPHKWVRDGSNAKISDGKFKLSTTSGNATTKHLSNGHEFYSNAVNSGEYVGIRAKTVSLATTAGASVSSGNFFPAGSILIGFTSRIVTEITGPATIDLGYTGALDAFGDNLATLTAGTTSGTADFKATTVAMPIFKAATNLVVTANGGNFTAGEIEVTIHYWLSGAPTE